MEMFSCLLGIIALTLCFVATECQSPCTTPNNQPGECISIKVCSSLLDSLITLNPSRIETVVQSKCKGGSDNFVCCPIELSSIFTTPTPGTQPTVNKVALLPNTRVCGLQHTDDRIHTDEATAIDEYPWLARLRFRKHNGEDMGYKCLGTLISNRYVLSTAHCIDAAFGEVYQVRLGEYNPQQDTDCSTTATADYQECSDPVLDIDVEQKITHKAFDMEHHDYDVGLIRLKQKVVYSDYIRPICLPLSGFKLAQPGELVFASGWTDALFRNGTLINKKKRAKLEVISQQECDDFFSRHNINITERHFCAKEKDIQSTCVGDSGGPIMFSNRYKWHIEGLVSFGPSTCGNGTITAGARIKEYVPWILENLRP